MQAGVCWASESDSVLRRLRPIQSSFQTSKRLCLLPNCAGAKPAIRAAQAAGKLDWSLPQGFSLEFEGLQGELYVGGVYVHRFLKEPGFALSAPKVSFALSHSLKACAEIYVWQQWSA